MKSESSLKKSGRQKTVQNNRLVVEQYEILSAADQIRYDKDAAERARQYNNGELKPELDKIRSSRPSVSAAAGGNELPMKWPGKPNQKQKQRARARARARARRAVAYIYIYYIYIYIPWYVTSEYLNISTYRMDMISELL